MLKRLALFAALAAILVAAAATAGEGPPVSGSVSDFSRIDPPLPAPGDSFKDANGDRIHLADFRGKLVLLNLWATWCGPCRQEMPSLDRLQAKLSPEGLVVLPLSLDSGGGPAVAMYYYQQGIDHLGVYVDPGQVLQARLRVNAVPTSFLIDRQGHIVGELQGSTQWDTPEAIALIRYYLTAPTPPISPEAPKSPNANAPLTEPAAFPAPARVQRVGTGLSPV